MTNQVIAPEAEGLANQALGHLQAAGLSSANLRVLVTDVFAELANNAAEHSASPVPYDWAAVELAVHERVTGTDQPTRGFGLTHVADQMRLPHRSLTIHSGLGALVINESMETTAVRTKLFPGTLPLASILGGMVA